jgi:hypothetical protein
MTSDPMCGCVYQAIRWGVYVYFVLWMLILPLRIREWRRNRK